MCVQEFNNGAKLEAVGAPATHSRAVASSDTANKLPATAKGIGKCGDCIPTQCHHSTVKDLMSSNGGDETVKSLEEFAENWRLPTAERVQLGV